MGRKHLTAVLLLAITAPALAADADSAGFQKIRAEAVTAIAKAAKMKYEWRDTEKLLEEADKAAAQNDYKKAEALADRARRQGELGYTQAVNERNAGDAAYVH